MSERPHRSPVPLVCNVPHLPAHLQHGKADPCTLVIFGAAGDLTRRMLIPAIYQLVRGNLVPDEFRIIGVAREPLEDGRFRQRMREALEKSGADIDEAVWERFAARLEYVTGDFRDESLFSKLAARIERVEQRVAPAKRNRVFYLATPPSVFRAVVSGITDAGLATKAHTRGASWSRIVVEKPFGRSEETAHELNRFLLRRLSESQIYRIDHYLGKETVQNILVFRFANSIFEPVWNRDVIANVQITVAETVGVETRGAYYEEAGVVRDMIQNHLLQVLALVAMEPPTDARDSVRNAKVAVLEQTGFRSAAALKRSVRAQYAGYRAEPNVNPNSATATFAALRLDIDNDRWRGVPFYLRSGKRLAQKVSEVAIQFRTPRTLRYGRFDAGNLHPNVLVLRIQPDEGIRIFFDVKVPGAAYALTPHLELAPVTMDFSYSRELGTPIPPAYETLLLDVMLGEPTLFARSDEVEAAWRVVDPLLDHWSRSTQHALDEYAPGSWGPAAADDLIVRDGFSWSEPRL